MKRRVRFYIFFAVAAVLLFFADLMTGSVSLSVKDLFSTYLGQDILLSFRLPKAIAALFSGVALAVCGLQMQTLFRNPLADPYILGVSSGAGLGVAIYLMGMSLLGITAEGTLLQTFGIAGAALAGALAVTLIILYVSTKTNGTLSLLIFGVMIGFIAGALVNLLQYTSNAHALKAYVLWTMGSFAGLGKYQLITLCSMIILGIALGIRNIKDLNAILLGEEYATSMGLNVKKIRTRILISTTLLAGGVTAFCGPIGFLGIAVPHIARFIFKNANHRVLFPAAALIGAAVTLLADAISQLPGSGTVIPVNTVAALLGIPVIIAIIWSRRNKNS